MRVPLRTLPIQHLDNDQIGSPDEAEINVAALEAALRDSIKGEVRFDGGTRGMYAHDASNYRMVPIGVVIPRDKEDVIAAVAAARNFGAPIIARGGGTAIPGQGVNCALMIDFSKYMNQVLSLDPENKTAVVQPGCVLDTLRDAAEKHELTFGPDPATHTRCTLGGMIGNNSCGIHSVMAGRTSDNIEELEVLLYDGTILRVGKTSPEELEQIIARNDRQAEIYWRLRDLRDRHADLIRERYPKIPRRVSGFNLDDLLPEKDFHIARALVGSECTCVIVLEAVTKLVDSPQARSLVVIGFPDLPSAGDFVPHCRKNYGPIGLEGLDDTFIDDMKKKGMHPQNMELMPKGRAWLLVEFGGKTKEESDAHAKRMMDDLKDQGHPMKLFDDPNQEKIIWNLREEGLGATAHVPGEKENHEGWEDTAVHPEDVGKYIRDFLALMDKYNYTGAVYGHFGDGCIHVRLDFELDTTDGIEHYRRFVQEGADLVKRYGGSLSGEHGDGQARGELLERMYGRELIEAMAEFKRIWDPDWKMNPGKVIAPYRLDENLAIGTDYAPPEAHAHFSYPQDDYSFAYAMKRCVGAGVCRRKEGGTMCPSYMVTHEEKHCTRGRARMLYEMLRGETITDGWQSEEVKDALDLCLACKGCKGDCPVQVDMATYKAEFLSHYYEKKPRPRQAYAFGYIMVWSRLAAIAPGFINLLGRLPGLNSLAKRLAGIDARREIPQFAPQTFKEWFGKRTPAEGKHGEVILWADTFNNHFHPQIAQAAVEVLEHAGYKVNVPMQNLCCGRPLYDYGLLKDAKNYLHTIVATLRDEIRSGTRVVMLEPSCCSVFRDELCNLFPHDEDAKRLKEQTCTLAEFLAREEYEPPKLKRKAILHGHCHHKAIMKMTSEEAVLRRMGIDLLTPDTGCCGMAGAFGFEEGDHFNLSIACGERVLLPIVRKASEDTIIIADGFSCREQIVQETHRTPLHFAQVLQMAIKEGEQGASTFLPETNYAKPARSIKDEVRTAAIIGASAVAVGLIVRWAIRKANGSVERTRSSAGTKRRKTGTNRNS